MVASCVLGVEPELSGLTALAQLLQLAGERRASERELARYTKLVERIGIAAAEVALLGLFDVCDQYAAAVRKLTTRKTLPAEVLAALQEWVSLVRAYALNPGDMGASQSLVVHLRLPYWQLAITDGAAASLLDALSTVPTDEQLATSLDETSMALNPLCDDLCFDANPAPAMESQSDETLSDEDVLAQLEMTSSTRALSETCVILPTASELDSDDAEAMAALLVFDDVALDEEGARDSTDNLLDEYSEAPAELSEWGDLDELVELSAPIPPAVQDILTVLIDELPQISISLDALVGLAGAAQVEPDVFANAVELTADMLARLGSTTESLGLAGLSAACEHWRSNLIPVHGDNARSHIASAGDLWSRIVPSIREYLRSPYDTACAEALATLLSDSRLSAPLSPLDAAVLIRQLVRPDLVAPESEGLIRPLIASFEDVSLDLPDDADPELVDALLHELPQQAEDLSAAVQRLLTGGSLEDVAAAQRIAHTIKGAGNTVGVRGIAELTHQLEDILIALAKHEVLPSPSLAETLVTASDCLQDMAEALQDTGPAPADSIKVLQEVLDWAHRIEREGPPMDAGVPPDSTGPADVLTPSHWQQAAPVDPGGPDLLRLVAEAMIQNSQLRDRVRSTRQDALTMVRQLDLLQQIGAELQEMIDPRDPSPAQQHRVSDPRFDAPELDQHNELHTHSRRLIQAAVDAREIGRTVIDNLGSLNEMLVTQERLNRDTQDSVLRARMIPVKSMFPRLERSVRQTCRMTGKQVELHLSGGETQMDSDVLARIVDPLMHVLRNAVDHGIEDAERREAAGKDPTGHITLEFLQDGKSILVRCRDDGSGLDFTAIREAAEQRGMIADGGEITEEMLKRFVLLPNFTTRHSVTQTSGRGIGLDAVHNSVAELGGSLTLSSTSGHGCVIEIRLLAALLIPA